MLTCLTNEDALRLIRKTTQKEFFSRLTHALANGPSKLDVREDHGEWSVISSLNHQLSRFFNNQAECSDWAIWSDFQSMHPMFIASWFWWKPLLQGALSVLQLPQARAQSMSLVDLGPASIWTVVAGVYTRGIDEVYLLEDCQWQSLLKPLPVSIQLVKNREEINKDSYRMNQLSPIIQPSAWYSLFRLLYQLSDELCAGHRVDFNQQLRHSDQVLDRLLTY
jgi:hypothetical protein